MAAAALAKRTAAGQRLAFRQRHRQRAVEHVAGRGGVDGFDRESPEPACSRRRRRPAPRGHPASRSPSRRPWPAACRPPWPPSVSLSTRTPVSSSASVSFGVRIETSSQQLVRQRLGGRRVQDHRDAGLRGQFRGRLHGVQRRLQLHDQHAGAGAAPLGASSRRRGESLPLAPEATAMLFSPS